MLATRAADASAAIVYVNLVGGQDELLFDGGSMVFDHDGTILVRLPQFENVVEVVDLEIREGFRKRTIDPRGAPVSSAIPIVEVVAPAADRVGDFPPSVARATRVDQRGVRRRSCSRPGIM